MAIDRTKNEYRHKCKTCDKVELLKYPTYWYRTKKGKDIGNSCSKVGNTQGFKKGEASWNSGKKLSGMTGKYYVTFKKKMPRGIVWGHNLGRRVA